MKRRLPQTIWDGVADLVISVLLGAVTANAFGNVYAGVVAAFLVFGLLGWLRN